MTTPESTRDRPATNTLVIGIVAWLWVLIPFAYGLYQLLVKIPALFAG
jgi:hypothetical protein